VATNQIGAVYIVVILQTVTLAKF